MLTAERARQLLTYDPTTGELRRSNSGAIAGTVRADGYRQVSIDGRLYRAHRVAWLMHTGAWPEMEIDHINMDRLDNRFANLRDVSHAVNKQNEKHARKGSRSGLLGVCAWRNKFKAQIRTGKKNQCLGVFETPADAHAAYIKAKRRQHVGCTI